MPQAVMPLDANPQSGGAPIEPPKPPIRRNGPRLLAAAAALAGALLLTIQPGDPTPLRPTTTEQPPLSLSAARPSAAADAFESFVTSVNRGDAAGALSLMLDELPEVVGLGNAEYPYLPSDAHLWNEGQLDRTNVEGFAHYVFTLPGSVVVSNCTGFGDGPRVTIVSCSYTTGRGPLAPLGQNPETGNLYGFMVDDKVAGLARRGDFDLELWERLATWAEDNHPEVYLGIPRPEGWLLEPEYTATAAHKHMTLAAAMAAENGGRPWILRVPFSEWSALDPEPQPSGASR